ASVRNVTRERIGPVRSPAAASFCESVSDATFRVTSPSVSYRNTFFLVLSGAISNSRQRIAHPFPRFSKHPLPYCRFVRAIRETPFPPVGSSWFSLGLIVAGDGNRITWLGISSRETRAPRERRSARTCRP